jgi:hypothetical protein
MKRFMNKKVAAIGLAAGLALGAAGAAFAYFTSTGSGSGSGTVGTSTNWTVAGGSVVGTLYPDSSYTGPDQGVVTGASITNAATSGYQNLNEVVATISGVTSTPVAGESACSTSDFEFNSPTATWTGSGTQTATIMPSDDLAPGASYNISDLNVVMVDNGAPQDSCQGATVTVSFAAS